MPKSRVRGVVGARVFGGAYSVFFLPLSVDFSAMLDLMNHDDVLIVKNLVDDAIIAYAEFVESCKVGCERLWSNVAQIGGEPIDTFGDSAGNGFIQSLKVTSGCLYDADAIHGSYSSPSRRTTSSNGSPRSPAATAFF